MIEEKDETESNTTFVDNSINSNQRNSIFHTNLHSHNQNSILKMQAN